MQSQRNIDDILVPQPWLRSPTFHLNEGRLVWAAAILLAMMAGYLDGYGLLFLKTYVSFMSGNTTSAGLRSGQGDFHAAIPAAIAIVFFVAGSFLATLNTSVHIASCPSGGFWLDCNRSRDGCGPRMDSSAQC